MNGEWNVVAKETVSSCIAVPQTGLHRVTPDWRDLVIYILLYYYTSLLTSDSMIYLTIYVIFAYLCNSIYSHLKIKSFQICFESYERFLFTSSDFFHPIFAFYSLDQVNFFPEQNSSRFECELLKIDTGPR